jgi:hypothetical protein
MKDISLYALMAEDHHILTKVVKGQVNLRVLDENDNEVYNETSHPYAWESLVLFARSVIMHDERVQKELTND